MPVYSDLLEEILDKHEREHRELPLRRFGVTQEEWQAILQNNPGINIVEGDEIIIYGYKVYLEPGGDDAECV